MKLKIKNIFLSNFISDCTLYFDLRCQQDLNQSASLKYLLTNSTEKWKRENSAGIYIMQNIALKNLYDPQNN